jgi:hypothetical protein
MSSWISVNDKLPNPGEAVLLWDGSRGMLGSYESMADAEGWVWCRSYSAPYWNGSRWQSDAAEYDNEYRITHWCRLDAPPET